MGRLAGVLFIAFRRPAALNSCLPLPSRPLSSKAHSRLWTSQESEKLLQLKRKGLTLREIAAAIPTRSINSIQNHYYRTIRRETDGEVTRRSKPWSAAESQRLKGLRESGADWTEIGRQFPRRTVNALRIQYGELAKNAPTMKAPRRAWTPAEDEILLQGRHELHLSWNDTAKRIPGRSTRATMTRYRVLDVTTPNKYVSPRNMTRDEIELGEQLHQSGMSWQRIRSLVPGRSQRGSPGHEGMAKLISASESSRRDVRSPPDDKALVRAEKAVDDHDRWAANSLVIAVRTASAFPNGAPARRPWTPEEETKLLNMYRLGQTKRSMPWGHMESEFNRTAASCLAKLDRLLKEV